MTYGNENKAVVPEQEREAEESASCPGFPAMGEAGYQVNSAENKSELNP